MGNSASSERMASNNGTGSSSCSLQEKYIASMVLSGVGDALGYKNGSWEFCHSGVQIHEELKQLGGLEKINVDKNKWMVSDDTVMHLATAEALVAESSKDDKEKLFLALGMKYRESMKDMVGRAPGATCMSYCHSLTPQNYRNPFNPRGGGCGAAMRAMCIGLRFPGPSTLNDLIAVSVESGRMTHHHPTGYLGSLAAALFVSYSLQGKPLNEWGAGLLETTNKALDYVKRAGVDVEDNVKAWGYFTNKWTEYLQLRQLAVTSSGPFSDPVFPDVYGIPERDKFYKSVSFSGWGGSSGHDAPMIAYDALLSSSMDWKELCSRSMFHSGDSDSTGVIAAACYGAMKGFHGVPENNYKNLEYRDWLELLGRELYKLANPSAESVKMADKDVQKIVDQAPIPPSDIPGDEVGGKMQSDSQNISQD